MTSVLCAIAPTVEVLIAMRALQGIAGALLVPARWRSSPRVFPPDERGAAIGTWTAWAGIATVLGPFGGGLLIDHASWRWIFAINVPFVLVTLVILQTAVPEARDEQSMRKIDYLGAVLVALGLAGPVFALIEQPVVRLGRPGGAGAVPGRVRAAGRVRVARGAHATTRCCRSGCSARATSPSATSTTLLVYGGFWAATFFVTIFLQQVAGYSAVAAGLTLLPLTPSCSPSRGAGARSRTASGRALLMGLGPMVAGLGLIWMGQLDAARQLPHGAAAGGARVRARAVDDRRAADQHRARPMPQHHAGVARGTNNAIARVAGLLAIAAVGAIVSAQFSSSIDRALAGHPLTPEARVSSAAKHRTLARADPHRLPPAEARVVTRAVEDASVTAFHLGIGISAALVFLGGVLGLVGIVNPRRAVPCADCPGGQLTGAPLDAGRSRAAPAAA